MPAGVRPAPDSGGWPSPPSPPPASRSLITRSGRYESRCMVRMYRRRAMSGAANLRYPERDLAGSISPSASRKRIFEVLISGNSGRSWASTSPIPNWPRGDGSVMRCFPRASGRVSRSPAARSCVVLGPPPAAAVSRRRRTEILAGEEEQPELADLDFVSAGQLRLLNTFPVHVGAVQAADVAHGEPEALTVELGVPPGDRHVVEEDVAVRVAARGGQVAVEPEPAARVGTAHDQQQRAARRQGAERRGVGEQVVGQVTVFGPAQRYRRGGLTRAGGHAPGPWAWGRGPGRHPGTRGHGHAQLSPAVRAEPGAFGIGPTAPGAVDAWHTFARPPLSLVLGFDRCCPRYARRCGAVHAPREQPAPSASVILVTTLPPHRLVTSAVTYRRSGRCPPGANRNARFSHIRAHSRIPRGGCLSHLRVSHTAYL